MIIQETLYGYNIYILEVSDNWGTFHPHTATAYKGGFAFLYLDLFQKYTIVLYLQDDPRQMNVIQQFF